MCIIIKIGIGAEKIAYIVPKKGDRYMQTVTMISGILALALSLTGCRMGTYPIREQKPAEVNTAIMGASELTADAAKTWARDTGASDFFIELADDYWEWGERFGIRPEVMYAQAAYETARGNFGNAVTADMNNFAGIKKSGAVDMAREDHESFATPSEGVRAHYNHMSAYVGCEPIGKTHGRYASVMRLSWAGTVKDVSELGGKWCPDPEYGNVIIEKFLTPMYKYK